MENVPRSFRKDLPKILLIVFTLLLLFIPAAKQFYADTRKPELAFADEHLDLHYSYEIKEDTQTILWTLSLKKSSIPSKLKVQLSSRVNTILEVSGYPLGENWRFDGNNCLEEIAIDQKQSELQINVETQIDPNQKNSYLDVDLSGEVSKLDEHGKEKLEPTQFKNQQKDIRLAAQNPLMDSELRKVGIIDQNLVVPNEQKLHNKSEDTVIIDLKDYLNETIFSKAEFMVRSEGIWEKYSISKHGSLNKTTPIRFYYEWTLEKVFANKDLRENVEKYQHQGMEVLFSHTFKLDNSLFLGIAEGSTTEEYSIKSPDKQEIFGTFTIRKGVGQEAHLWKTVWNEESWNSDVLNGNMYFMSTIVVNQETSKEEITILDDDYIQEIVEIQKDVSGYSLSKQHRYTHDYIELLTIEENEVPVKTTPITWQTSIAPLTEGTQDKIVLKNLFIQDKDVSNDFETSSRKGVAFQFPGAGKYAEAWQQYFMKKKIPFFEVRNEKTGLLYNEGTDYSLKYKSYDDGMNNGFEIQFHKDIDNEILITYTTLTTPYHPADSIDNRVMSDTSNFGKRTAEASTSLYRHGIEKKGEDIGFGRVRWTVFYYRDKNTGAESFIDKISKGKILIDTLEVQDESGASGEAVDGDFYQIDYKGSHPQEMKLSFKAEMPPGRYIISYISEHESSDTKPVSNHFYHSEKPNFGSEIVVDPAVKAEKSVIQDANTIDKTIIWKARLQTINSGGTVEIQDAAPNQGLHYYYQPSDEQQMPQDIKASTIKEGIILTAVSKDDKERRIPREAFQIEVNNQKGFQSILAKPSWGDEENRYRSGFKITITDKSYIGMTIQLYVSTKYGDTADIIPKLERSNQFHNTVEIKQGSSSAFAEVKTRTYSEVEIVNDIVKFGKFSEINKKINWSILANTKMMSVNQNDWVIDALDVNHTGYPENDYQFFTEEDLTAIEVFAMKPHSKYNKEKGLFDHYDTVKLIVGTDYTVEKITKGAEIKSFKIIFLRDLQEKAQEPDLPFEIDGTMAIGIKASSHIEIADDEGGEAEKGIFKFKNRSEQSISTIKDHSLGEVSLTIANRHVYKTVETFTEAAKEKPAEIEWSLVLNAIGETMNKVKVVDLPDNQQYVDLNTIKVYRGIPDNGDIVPTELLQDCYQLSPRSNGFEIIFEEEYTVDFPLVIHYTAVISDAETSEISNKAWVYWGADREENYEVFEELHREIGGGTGESNFYAINLTKVDHASQNRLTDVHFDLYFKQNGRYQKVAELKTNAQGLASVNGLNSGEYYLEESAPNGYRTVPKGYFSIPLQENEVVQDEDGKSLEEIYQLTSSGTYVFNLNIQNNKKSYKLMVNKKDQQGQDLSGAKFSLKNQNTHEYIKPIESETNFTFENLEEGEYLLTETESPKGYIGLNKSLKVTIDKNYKVTINYEDGSEVGEEISHIQIRDTEKNETYNLISLNIKNQGKKILPLTGVLSNQLLIITILVFGAAAILILVDRHQKRKGDV